jgi:hypothetical protein
MKTPYQSTNQLSNRLGSSWKGILFLCILIFSMHFPGYSQSRMITERDLQQQWLTIQSRVIGSLTLEEWVDTMALWQVYEKQQNFIRQAGIASYIIPGLGQFIAKDTLGGVLILFGNTAITIGTLIGANALLPPSVRIGNLDYFGSSFQTIQNAWADLTFISLLPSIGITAAGTLATILLRSFAADDARIKATQAIAQGKIRFEPDAGLTRAGELFFGVRIRGK